MSRKTTLLVLGMFIVVAFLLLSPRLSNRQTPPEMMTETPPNVAPTQDVANKPEIDSQDTGDARDSAADAPSMGMDDVPANADVASEPMAEDDKTMELPPAEGQ